MPERRAGVDAVLRAGEARLEREVRRRIAERASTLVAGDDDAVELERPPEQRGCRADVALLQSAADRRRGDARHRLDVQDLEAEPPEQLAIAAPPGAEAEVGAGGDRLGADRPQVALGEHLGLERHQLRRERRDQRCLDPGIREQLQPALERRDQLDIVAERDPRVRIERDHGRREAGVDRGLG